jgi:hypothetical protein
MAAAGKEHGYQYLGISDHSQALKIEHGLSESALREQIRFIDNLDERFDGIRICHCLAQNVTSALPMASGLHLHLQQRNAEMGAPTASQDIRRLNND